MPGKVNWKEVISNGFDDKERYATTAVMMTEHKPLGIKLFFFTKWFLKISVIFFTSKYNELNTTNYYFTIPEQKRDKFSIIY